MSDRTTELEAVLGSLATTLRTQAEGGRRSCEPRIAAELVRHAEAALERVSTEAISEPSSVEPTVAEPLVADERTEAPSRAMPGAEGPPASRVKSQSGLSTPPKSVPHASSPAGGGNDAPPWIPRRGGAAPKGVGSPALAAIREEIGDCERCGLCARRANIVFGVGSPAARLMFVGEGPGADEDRQGEPFVGRAGQLLTKMIGAMGLKRSDVYIANVVKCRPPGNRDPAPDEVAKCRPFLDQQIAAVAPEAIVCLGKVAASTLLDRNVAITHERGKWTEYRGVPLLLTLHPAYLLRQQQAKAEAWADLQLVMKRLGLTRPGGK